MTKEIQRFNKAAKAFKAATAALNKVAGAECAKRNTVESLMDLSM